MRYAIYYVPPRETPLANFGAAILAYDVESGSARERLAVPGIAESLLVSMTRRAARYGFHATLKAPFRLAAGRSRIDVLKLAADTADRCHPVEISGLELAMLGNFATLRPQQTCPEFDAIAATFVCDLDPLRVVEARDEAKWPPGKLSARQGELLEAWGYPYVFDQYRFHMTLTDALNADEAVEIPHALKLAAANVTNIPLTIDAVTVVEEINSTAPFRAIARFHLRGLR
jgi:hypothetical protein